MSGNVGVAKDALAKIASRLRMRCLRDFNARAEPAPVKPVPGFGPTGNLRDGCLSLISFSRTGSSGRREYLKVSIFCLACCLLRVPCQGFSFLSFICSI